MTTSVRYYMMKVLPQIEERRFFDLITWNIKFFNNRDPKRVVIVGDILRELNADILVFQG